MGMFMGKDVLEASPAAAFPYLGKFGNVELHVYAGGVRAEALWLNSFSRNDKHLSGTPGAVAVLHTHNRRLGFHPHVHVCMPAAAFDARARLWRTKVKLGKAPGHREPARGGFLFSHKALARVFAGKLQAALRAVGLALPADLPSQWVVDCKAVGDGQQALKYLGRYLYRGVISERDILRCKDGQITYRWRDAKSGKSATRSTGRGQGSRSGPAGNSQPLPAPRSRRPRSCGRSASSRSGAAPRALA